MADTGDSDGTTGDGRRLTYAQIAARLGISGEAARIMVRRRGWQRILPNHPRGLTVVIVPDDALTDEDWRRVAPTVPDEQATPGDAETGQGEQPAPGVHLMAGALAALETAVMSLTERALAAERRAEESGIRADRAEVRAEAAEQVAKRARREAAEALQRAEAVERAEVDRKARGLVARLRAALRGE